jgi:hypothetical protein
MSLDFSLMDVVEIEVFEYNITHNLGEMANYAGIYKHLWRPEELGIEKAEDLIKPLKEGLDFLTSNPDMFRKYNPENGWGKYEDLIKFIRETIEACEKYPNAKIETCR